jgi:hypothetical protein
MHPHDRVALLHGPYHAPALRKGDFATCFYRDCDVVVTSWTDAPGPIINLQLGGRRGRFGPWRAAVPTRDWLDALDHCADAAGCFDSAIAGVDLVFERRFRRHFVLEVNAFGDFFPGWIGDGGQSVHALEIVETTQKLG